MADGWGIVGGRRGLLYYEAAPQGTGAGNPSPSPEAGFAPYQQKRRHDESLVGQEWLIREPGLERVGSSAEGMLPVLKDQGREAMQQGGGPGIILWAAGCWVIAFP
jgi:hypothetical protein